MVDRLVTAITGESDVASGWRSLVTPTDRVGIKICAAGGELFTTHRDVVGAIADGLAAAGVARENIVVWDRDLDRVTRAGYRSSDKRYRVVGIQPIEGYDPKAEVSPAFLGKLVWGDLGFVAHRGVNPIAADAANTSTVSHLAKIVTSGVTKIINVPVMSQSETTGIAGCLYNMTLPNIDNWRRFTQYESMGAAAMVDIYRDPRIAQKVVLHIMDGLAAAYAGGPEAHPNFAVHSATLLASRDPVALDTIALQRIEQLRAKGHLSAVGNRAAHVQIAGQVAIGNADRARIEVRELGR
jgi:uncharacterized protein (DUF362 family)